MKHARFPLRPWKVFLTLLLFPALAEAASEVRVWEEDVVLPTYRLGPGDPNPMFYTGESYQGAQKRIYPYPLLDRVTNIREEKAHRFVFLENDFIRLSILPEIGGRLFSAQDKTNGYNIFYRQHVIKPALIGMLGAWISGGIEWCVFHHHRNTTHMPVDFTVEERPDGSKTIWFGETERRHRMRWVIGITLYPDKSYIEAHVKLINRTALPHSMLYWANVAVHANEDYQVIFPPSVRYATYHAKNDFAHWPVAAESYQRIDYHGVDLSWWKNHPEPISFFAWDLREDFMGGYDHGKQAGVAHVGNHHIVSGAKLWEWSPGPRGRMWDKILTDTDGPYAELMVGAYSDNQPDYSWIQPYEVREFKQYWFPIREISGLKKANLEAAANLELDQGQGTVTFGLNTTSKRNNARVVVTGAGSVIFDRRIDISPAEPFVGKATIAGEVRETDILLTLFDQSGQELISYRPAEKTYDPKLPDPVQPPRDPKEIETVEELYLTGLRVRQIYNPGVDPAAYFDEALRRDPGDTRTNTIVGIDLYSRGEDARAETHLRRAIHRISAEYTRPMNAGAYYYLGLVLRAMGREAEASDSFYRATWDQAFHSAAYYQLAELSCKRGDFETALQQVEKSLLTNTLNRKAAGVRAAILRKLGRTEDARLEALSGVASDPLDFQARNELALSSPGPARDKALSELRKLMRDDVQSYLELATDYGSTGMWDEAIEVLRRPVEEKMDFAGTYPMVYYYLSFYSQKKNDREASRSYLELAPQMPPEYCFPFRLESIEVLESAVSAGPQDARARYYLGNLLFEIQPGRAVLAWEDSRELDPEFATVNRNLGWAYSRYQKDIPKALAAYERAVGTDPGDPRLFNELDQLYEIANVAPRKRLALLESHPETVESSNDSLLREILVQVLVGQYDRAIEALENHFFHVREGGGEVHDVFVDAHLLRGLTLAKEGRQEDSLKDFLRAADYPENLSVGVPRRDPRASEVSYHAAKAYELLGDRVKAVQYYRKAAEQESIANYPEAGYYRARSLQKLGRGEEAVPVFARLIEEGRGRLAERGEVDFFAKFGERESDQSRRAFGLYLIGLGHLGTGDPEEAKAAFARSVELNASNVWAKYQLETLQ